MDDGSVFGPGGDGCFTLMVAVPLLLVALAAYIILLGVHV